MPENTMAAEPLVLVINPRKTSRIYALYRRGVEIAFIHIEYVGKKLLLHLTVGNVSEDITLHDISIDQSLEATLQVCLEKNIINESIQIDAVALRIIAPSGHFLEHRIITDHEILLLKKLQSFAPQHIDAMLQEIDAVHVALPQIPIIGVSDSAFHATKPDYTWNYGISLQDADAFDIKRFGYNGLSVASVMKQIKTSKYSSLSKVIVCHIGSGTSVTAVYNGKSVDTTMGYTPNEGPIMAGSSGTVELTAGLALARQKNISPEDLAIELQTTSGLRAISGASDNIKELLRLETVGNHRAELALCMYIYSIRQAIARMIASLEGVDMVVFTGSIGQGSPEIRSRIVKGLDYLGVVLSPSQNTKTVTPQGIVTLHPRTRSKPVIIVPSQEERIIAALARKLML